jgi:hypothetical protein
MECEAPGRVMAVSVSPRLGKPDNSEDRRMLVCRAILER